ncbi:MAG: hypothetical protein ACLQO7_11000 [Candidatus Bathyarchaeia archaeon]
MDRKEAVALLKEIGIEQLIQPSLVLVEKRKPDSYQLKIKGNYDLKQITIFLKNRGFSLEENEDTWLSFNVQQ